MPLLTLDDVEALSTRMLIASGASPLQAGATARSIRGAEADGIRTVGLGYLPIYCDHLACAKVVGTAVPVVSRPRAAVVSVDAGHGFAHPAFEAGLDDLVDAARAVGIALMSVSHSYSAGVLGWFVEQVAERGLVSVMFANSSPLMAAHGGRRPFFGTNPLAWAVPRPDGSPVVADLSSSMVAWVTVNAAAQAGRPIPEGWALDPDGRPTTDSQVALTGTMAPAAGHKGSALALLVDIMGGAVTGSSFSFEASGFGDNAGGPPDVGQVVLAIDPMPTAGPAFLDRVATELVAMTADDGVRLPGDRRLAHRQRAEEHGVEVPDDLLGVLADYAEHGSPVR